MSRTASGPSYESFQQALRQVIAGHVEAAELMTEEDASAYFETVGRELTADLMAKIKPESAELVGKAVTECAKALREHRQQIGRMAA